MDKEEEMFVEKDDLESVLSKSKEPKKQETTNDNDDGYRYSSLTLPSGGEFGYPEEIEYRDILVKDEKVLASSTEKTFGKCLNKVLKSLLKDQSFYEKLTIHDRDFLLVWVWANNYSTIKHIEMSCPHCDAKNSYKIDLTELEIKSLDEGFKNPYPYTTVNGEDVSFRMLTVNDEAVARDFCRMNKEYEENLVSMCLSVNLKVTVALKERIKHIEDNFTGKDMSILRGFHRHFKYGVVDSAKEECKSCGEVNRFSIPFQVDFFIPSLSDDFG